MRPGRREASGDRGASSVRGGLGCRFGEGGAHVEHVEHVRDFGRVEAQRLVERRRGLPRVERKGIRCGARYIRVERREAAGNLSAFSVCRAELDCRLGAGHGEERTRNMSSMSVTLEVSKLSGWLNADAPCRESKERACGAGRGTCDSRSVQERVRLQTSGQDTGRSAPGTLSSCP